MNKINKKIVSLVCAVATIICSIGLYTPVYGNSTDVSKFPSSYRPYINALLEEHPDWVYKPYNTGIDWNELVEYQCDKNRSLIEKSSNPEIYFSKAEGDYDASTGTYIGKSGSNWVTPATSVVKHYLDPRNFLNDEDIFMFLKLSFNEDVHTSKNVNILLKNTWMYKKELEDDSSMTYAQAFVKIGRATDVSAFFLAARVVQENGSGTSALISGTYPGYEGYYNYFNHGAYGSTEKEIIVNGLKSAKENGWNTRYKSLYGGSKTLATRYIARKQDTLYFQKFDVVDGISYHQYMQNIQAPISEGWTMRKTYKSAGLLEEEHVFSIPVYENMPSKACALPSKTTATPTPTPTEAPISTPKLTVIQYNNTLKIKLSGVDKRLKVTRVYFPVWSIDNAQDDIVWYIAEKKNDDWILTVNISSHKSALMSIYVHSYTTDSSGELTFAGGELVKIRKSDPLWGDVNNDKIVDAEDALCTLKAAVGLETLSSTRKAAADVNFDGYCGAEDALFILKNAVGLTSLPVITW